MLRRALIFSACAGLSFLAAPLPDRGDELGDPKWGPFRGRIIDADTGQPIPGAVALVIWLETLPTPVQTNQKFYDARIGVAGLDGTFEVPRRTPPFFSTRISTPLIEYFAPGYALTRLVESADGLEVAELRTWGRLTPEQQRRHHISAGTQVFIPHGRRPELIQIINAERQRMGLHPIRWLIGGPE